MTARAQSETALVFKRCPMCGTSWASRDEFLADAAIKLVGYQVDFRDLVAGLFLFNHDCGDTVAVPASVFRDLHTGPVFSARAKGTAECPGQCLREDDLDPCPTHCECAYVREVLQVVKNWQKT